MNGLSKTARPMAIPTAAPTRQQIHRGLFIGTDATRRPAFHHGCRTGNAGIPGPQPSEAFCSSAMTSFRIPSIACIARWEPSGSVPAISDVSTDGMTCQETP